MLDRNKHYRFQFCFLIFFAFTVLVCARVGATEGEPAVPSIATVQDGVQAEVRAEASDAGKLLGNLSAKDSLSVEEHGDWYQIADGRYKGGFVRKEALKLTGERYLIYRVKKSDARVRGAASTSGNVLGVLQIGASFAAMYAEGVHAGEKWLQIKDGPYRGAFIAAELLNNPQPVAHGAVSPVDSVGYSSQPSAAAPTVQNAPIAQQAAAVSPAAQSSASTAKAASPIQTAVATPTTAATPAPAPTAKPAKSHADDLAPAPWNDKVDKIFEERLKTVFKKKAAEETQVQMPVYFEAKDKLIGQVESRVQSQGPLLVDAPIFFKYLRQVIAPAWFEKPEIQALDPEKVKDSKESLARAWVPVTSFVNSGISVRFHEHSLDITISVPPEMRSPTIASIFKFDDTKNEEARERAEFFSTYLNINASEVFDTRSVAFSDRRVPVKAQLESGTNIGSLVLEANGRYLENRIGSANTVPEFTRSDVRLVKDFPGSLIRTSVGDIIYPVQGFQTFRPMAGAAISSNFTMARSKLTYPTGNYELFLQRDSKVYIWINNQLQKVVELPAGRHSLQDFPFTSGNNELRFEIIDDVGRQETQVFSYFSSAELLRPGLHQFSYAVGQPSFDTTGTRTYDENMTISAFHRFGLREDLTLGANLQYDKYNLVAGAEALFSGSYGFIRLVPAFSQTAGGINGGAITANYIYSDDKGPAHTTRTFNVGLSHTGTTFAPFGPGTGPVIPGSSSKIIEFNTGYSRALNQNLSGNISGLYGYYSGPTGNLNAFTVRVGANRRWKEGLNLNLGISHTKTTAGAEDLALSGFLIWAFPEEKQVISAIHNTADRSSRVDWGYNASEGTDSANYGAAIRDNATEQGYSVQTNADTNRARVGLTHEVVLTKPGGQTVTTAANQKDSNNVTTLLVGTSIAFAGGHIAIGRPVTDSFAIIAPVKNLRGQRLDINPQGEDRYLARTSFLGPALVPELGSYNASEISVSGRHLPPQMSLPRDHYSIFPSYKSGYTFEAGTDAVVFLSAKIIGPDGSPIALSAGTATYLDSKDEPPVTVFTNKSGTLRSEGFKAGRYRLAIAAGTFAPIEITIPESATESFDAGTLQLKAE